VPSQVGHLSPSPHDPIPIHVGHLINLVTVIKLRNCSDSNAGEKWILSKIAQLEMNTTKDQYDNGHESKHGRALLTETDRGEK
jgi:hypothetical protein